MKFEIIAGDFPKKTEYVSSKKEPKLKYKGEAWSKHMISQYANWIEIPLSGKVERVETVTEENKKKILGSTSWGLTGGVVGGSIAAFGAMAFSAPVAIVAAPVAIAAALAGVIKGGNKKEVCFACYLKDGKKFMAVADSKIYMEISSLCF